jgi:hypothetical protein
MDLKQSTDLERRLAARLHPARVLGAEETWARIAPTLGSGGAGRWRALPALGAAFAAILVIAMASALVLTFQETNTGGMGGQPAPPTPTVQLPGPGVASASNIGMGTNGSLVTGISPAPPFAVFQPTALPTGMELIASAYNPSPLEPNQQRPVAGGASSMLNGPGTDPALMQAAVQRSQQLLGDGHEVALVLIYAASADDQIELVQRSAARKALPAGDPLTVHGLAATKTQRDGRTVVTWIEAGTFLELYVTAPTEEPLQLANSLHETALTTPMTLPATPGIAAPSVINMPASLTNRRGAVSVPQPDRQAIAQQCGAWDAGVALPSPRPPTTMPQFTTAPVPANMQKVACAARLIAGVSDETNVSVSQLSWSQVAEQLGVDPALWQSSDAQVLLVTLNFSNSGGTVVVLDAATGTPIVQVQLLPVP